MAPEVAVRVTGPPAFTPVATPLALTVAIVLSDDVHVAVLVRFCVVPSEKCPVALNGAVFPAVTDALAGVTVIDVSAAAVTVSEAVPAMAPEVAVRVTGPPAFTPVATPLALTVAIVLSDEVHVAVLVRFCVVPSEKCPVALNGAVFPTATDVLAGATVIDVSAAAVTVSEAVPAMAPEVAVRVTGPSAFTPVATPVALIVAMVVSDDVHVAVLVRFCVVPSEKCPVALNGAVFPTATDALAGVTRIHFSAAARTAPEACPTLSPHVPLEGP